MQKFQIFMMTIHINHCNLFYLIIITSFSQHYSLEAFKGALDWAPIESELLSYETGRRYAKNILYDFFKNQSASGKLIDLIKRRFNKNQKKFSQFLDEITKLIENYYC